MDSIRVTAKTVEDAITEASIDKERKERKQRSEEGSKERREKRRKRDKERE